MAGSDSDSDSEYSEAGGVPLPPLDIANSDSEQEQEEGLFDNNGPKSALPTFGPAELAGVRQNRTVFVRSLAKNTTTEHLQLHFSQVFPVKHAVVVVDPKTGESNGYGFVMFGSESEAKKAIEEMHGTILNGHKIKVELAKPRNRRDKEAEGIPGGENGVKPDSTQSRPEVFQSKLIVRNLSWSVKDDKALTALFQSYGKVLHAVVPKDQSGKLRGFGIVVLKGRKNAENAKEAMNGKTVSGRTITVDWALDKNAWEAKKDSQKKADFVQEGPDSEGSESVDAELDDEDDSDEDEDSGDEANHEDHQADEENDEIDQKEPEDLSPTIFIRNLPFECDDEALFNHFKQFGRLRYARVVYGDVAERSRGTGFVCFSNPEDAVACLRGAPKNSNDVISKGGTDKDKKKAAFRSVLQNDASDPSGKYTIDGRVLQISPAVARGEASRLAEENLKKRNQRDKDKRRLFLLNEAHIPPTSPLGKSLSPVDIQLREASMKQRKKLLDTNPSLFVSLTRLSVRNIPRGMSSSELKALARQAVVGYATDAKAGKRPALTKDELERGGDAMAEADRQRRARGKGIVKQTKIEFESKDGTKMKEGEGGRSRGYGFIEYYTHRNALMALRWLNGMAVAAGAASADENTSQSPSDLQGKGGKHRKNPKKSSSAAAGGEGKKRLVVEFALENANVVQRRAQQEQSSREKSKQDRFYASERKKKAIPRVAEIAAAAAAERQTGSGAGHDGDRSDRQGAKARSRDKKGRNDNGKRSREGGDRQTGSSTSSPTPERHSKKMKRGGGGEGGGGGKENHRSEEANKAAMKNRMIAQKRFLRKTKGVKG